MGRIRLALAQLNPVVGDIDGNAALVEAALARAAESGSDLVAFPELVLTGYPPEDLLLKPAFVEANLAALHRVAGKTGDCAAVVGFVDVIGAPEGAHALDRAGRVGREDAVRGAPRHLRNAAAVCARGRVLAVYHKRLLPNYGVFDEERWFAPGTTPIPLFRVAGARLGVSVCEDLWFERGPIGEEARAGAGLVVNINASPYSIGRRAERVAVLAQRAVETGCAIAYVNCVGGQDELVFDGGSMVVSPAGEVHAAAPQFAESLLVCEVDVPDDTAPEAPGTVVLSAAPRDPAPMPAPAGVAPDLAEEAEVYAALVLGTRDYLRKSGFTDAVLGLSGGVDSALVATVAADAIGAGHVHALAMPSRYSSASSLSDARLVADNLGIDLRVVPIDDVHRAVADLLAPVLDGPPVGVTDENLQSRLRGIVLMAVSNARGWIVLTTGNKSELGTGYSTLYGDSAGGFAVIRDVPKTLVYRLCRWRNATEGRDLVPDSVLTKAPSAELRPDQRDDESLPPYDVLDPVLAALVEEDHSVADLVAMGYDEAMVLAVARLVDGAEYKRRQSPPGVRITARAFGKDRRMPIVNRFRPAPAPAPDGVAR